MAIEQINTIKSTVSKDSSDKLDLFPKIGEYRGELLGMALILISIAHLQPHIATTNALHLSPLPQYILNLFNFSGGCGVKIFFILAGYGAYFSLCRNPDDVQFYVRRAKRMFPYYYPLVFLCLLIEKPALMVAAGNLSLIGWWITTPATRWSQYFWFHQAIYIIYLITPIFFRILNSGKKAFRNTIFLWLVFLGAGLAFLPEVKVQGVQSIPLFITGMLLSKLNIEGFKISKKIEPISYILGACAFVLLVKFFPTYGGVYGDNYAPTTLEHLLIDVCTAAILLLFLRACIFINKENRFNAKLMKVLSVLGHRSLEIYLIQYFVLYQILNHHKAEPFKYLCSLLNLNALGNVEVIGIITGVIIVCSLMGVLYGILMDLFMKKISSFYKYSRIDALY